MSDGVTRWAHLGHNQHAAEGDQPRRNAAVTRAAAHVLLRGGRRGVDHAFDFWHLCGDAHGPETASLDLNNGQAIVGD